MPGLQRLPLPFGAPGRYGVGRYNDNGLRSWAVVSQGNVDSGFTARRCNGAQSRKRAARERHRRAAARKIDDAHVTPEHAAAESCAERLGTGFLGGKTFGIGFNRLRPALSFGPLGRRKNTIDETIAMPLNYFRNSPHIDDVGAKPNDHACAFFRPRSMATRMSFIVSVRPSNTDSPTRKWPMLSSTTCGSVAIVSAVP